MVTDFLDELALVPLEHVERPRDASNGVSNVIINIRGFYDALICAILFLFLPLVSCALALSLFNWKRNHAITRYRSKSSRHKQMREVRTWKSGEPVPLENRKFHLSAVVYTRANSLHLVFNVFCSVSESIFVSDNCVTRRFVRTANELPKDSSRIER